ncbi:MAG: hypothetical protein OEY96_09705 [Gammaproteobacteria bacterium]|nr:hypothetical protein [Gammaproteobacteria bacterium]
MKKIIITVSIVLTLLVLSNYRAYFYNDETLKSIAYSAFDQKFIKRIRCKEIKFYQSYRPDKWSSVVSYEWLCINKNNDNYAIASVVESDGYVEVMRIHLSDDEIKQLIHSRQIYQPNHIKL